MSNVDWSQAPDGAEFCVNRSFYKASSTGDILFFQPTCGWVESACQSRSVLMQQKDYCERPQQWPDEQRLEIIGHNGPTGEHYAVVDLFEAELVKEGYSKDMLHKNTSGQYYQGYLNSLFKWFAKGVQAQCNK